MPPRALGLALGLLAAGCARSPQPPSPPVTARRADTCVIMTDSAGPPRPITAAFDDPANARNARLAASRLAPVRLDCEGRARPGLASRWSPDSSGRFWTLEFPGSPAPAPADQPRWSAATLAATWRSDPDASRALRDAGVVSLLPLDDARLVVGFAAPQRDLPAVFATRALGVATGRSPRLTEQEPATGDLRDAIDGAVDLVVTGDPDLLEYAGRRPGHSSVALPWHRLYLLLLPSGDASLGPALPADTSGFRMALAENAVRTDARPAEPVAWPDSAARCAAGTVRAASASTAVAYSAGDPAARDLAERLVALAGPEGLAVRPLEPDSFSATLRRGDARAFVVSGPRVSAAPCAESSGWPAGARVIPLVETRAHAIVRRGAPPLVAEWDGAVRAAEAGDTAGAAP